jgi:signal peptidase II
MSPGSPRGTRRPLVIFSTTAVAALALAQLGSYLVQLLLPLHETFVVNRVVHFTHIRNTGLVFGVYPGSNIAVAVAGAAVVVGGCLFLLRTATRRYQFICLGLIVGAAASNVLDRIIYGAVIDFIDIQGIPYWHYIFNTADLMIHLGAWPLAIGAMIRPEP